MFSLMLAAFPMWQPYQEYFSCPQLTSLVLLFGTESILNQQQLLWEHSGVLENSLSAASFFHLVLFLQPLLLGAFYVKAWTEIVILGVGRRSVSVGSK